MKPTDAHKKGEWGVELRFTLHGELSTCQPLLFALLKGQFPKEKKMMDCYKKKGSMCFFQVNQHYDIIDVLNPMSLKHLHSCNEWLEVVDDFEV